MEERVAHILDETKERTQDVRVKIITPFSKMNLSQNVHKGLLQAGFLYPTVVQAAAIPMGKCGFDLLVQSKSGTGKTLIFGIILLETYNPSVVAPQALILVPTREIAVQIEEVLNRLGRSCPNFQSVSVIGGTNIMDDRKRLQHAKAVIGTPKRVIQLIRTNVLNTAEITLLVLDEADKMYSSSFRGDIEYLRKQLPANRRTIACSATFANDLDRELAKVMRSPLLISTSNRATLLLGIKQFVYEIIEQKVHFLAMALKLDALRHIFRTVAFKQCIVFAGSQIRADSYFNYLEKEGWPCDLISGAQDQKTRLDVFRKFRDNKIRILVSTDLMSRGIDSEHVNLVINLELPYDVVTYLHRIGRAGRFGSHGIAITFVASDKERGLFANYALDIHGGMSVLKFPNNERMSLGRDLWDFSDPKLDAACYGIFGEETSHPYSDPTVTEENKENQCQNISNSSLNTKTFKIDSKDSAVNLFDFIDERKIIGSHSSLQFPSSNTIDDASSIAADSINTSQQDISSSVFNKLGPKPSLLNLLVDQKPYSAMAGGCDGKPLLDPFNAYPESIPDTTSGLVIEANELEPPEECSINLVVNDKPQGTINTNETSESNDNYANNKNITTIINNLTMLLTDNPMDLSECETRCRNIFSDLIGIQDDTASTAININFREELDTSTFLLSVATPTQPSELSEGLQDSSILSAPRSGIETKSFTEVKPMVSSVQNLLAQPIFSNSEMNLSEDDQVIPGFTISSSNFTPTSMPSCSANKWLDNTATSVNNRLQKLSVTSIEHIDIPPASSNSEQKGCNEDNLIYRTYLKQLNDIQKYVGICTINFRAMMKIYLDNLEKSAAEENEDIESDEEESYE